MSDPVTAPARPDARFRVAAALGVLGLISTCAFTYEFLLSAQHGYLTGDSLKNMVINMVTMIVAMGLGQFASRWVNWQEVGVVRNELLVALVGGNANLVLYALWIYAGKAAGVAAPVYSMLLGAFIGLQYPLFVRIVSRMGVDLRHAVSWVALADYLPAVPAAVIYVLILQGPGMVAGAYIVGMANVASAALALLLFREQMNPGQWRRLWALAAGVLAVLVGGLLWGERLALGMEQQLYDHLIVYRQQTPFQRIVVTRGGPNRDVRLFLNGNLQFNAMDEYRYHEALVHIPMAAATRQERVLILGGGDGLAAREVLRWPEVRQVVLVDIDPAVTELARSYSPFVRLNAGSLEDPRVRVVNADAFKWLEEPRDGPFDVVVVDLPDPNNPALAKLYSREFYRLIRQHLAPDGAVSVQSTSPYGARKAFWTVVRTVEAAGFHVRPYHVYVPSFGDWGFTLATPGEVDVAAVAGRLPVDETRYLTPATATAAFVFAPDVRAEAVQVSTLVHPTVITAYQEAWQELWQ